MADEITNDQDLSKPGFHLLPARPGTCAECAVDHAPSQPHNQQSMYYQYHFYAEHNRWPTWDDAVAHCSPVVKALWVAQLAKQGIVLKVEIIKKGLSYSRPWDYLITHEPFKDVENRKWPTSFRGRTYVHRAKSWDEEGYKWIQAHAAEVGLPEGHPFWEYARGERENAAPQGCIVGEVEIVGCMKKGEVEDIQSGKTSLGDQERELKWLKEHWPQYFSPWFFGPYGFVLANPVGYEAGILYRGMRGVFDVDLGGVGRGA